MGAALDGRARRWLAALATGMVALSLTACGGDDGGPTTKAAWQKEHGDLVAAFERDLDAANTTINQGEKQATISACTQLSDDATEMRNEVFPVPNREVDRPLRQSVDLALKASKDCVQGGRSPEGASQVEAAMRGLTDARKSFEEARLAIAAWR